MAAKRGTTIKRSKTVDQGANLLDDDVEPDSSDEAPAAEAKTTLRGDKRWAELNCATCGRPYWRRYLKSVGVPVERCCGDLYCHAVQNWTDEEWALRARSVHHHRPPPPAPFSMLRPAGNGQQCLYCGKPMAIYVIPMTNQGHDRATACTGCSWLSRTYRYEPAQSDRLDAEALRRWPSPPPMEPLAPKPLTLPAPASPPPSSEGPAEPPAPAAVVHPTTAVPVPAPPQSSEPPAWSGWSQSPSEPPAWLARLHDRPAAAPELHAMPFDSPPGPPGSLVSAVEQPPAPVAQATNEATICQLVGRQDGHLWSKCGRKVKVTAKVVGPTEAGMSAFDSQVNCTRCRTAEGFPAMKG